MSNILMKGTEPIGQVSDLTADNIEYSEGVSVKQKIDGMIESGSNANGSWIKYADGTMICTKTVIKDNVSVTQEWGSFYESTEPVELGDWSQTFYATPTVSINAILAGASFFVGNNGGVTNTSAGAVRACRPSSATIDARLDIIAIGRWKA